MANVEGAQLAGRAPYPVPNWWHTYRYTTKIAPKSFSRNYALLQDITVT